MPKKPESIAFLEAINKKYGEGTLVDLSKKSERPVVECIRTGLPSLDLVLGNGIPLGRIMEIYGHESSGKSSISLYIMQYFQKVVGKKVAYIDAENSFDLNYAGVMGCDLDDFFLSQPETGEQALDITEKLCQSNEIGCIVIDSVAALVPAANFAKEIDGTANIGTTARLLSQNLARLSQAARASKTTIIFINQLREKIGMMYGNPETTPGGKALKYFASVRLEVKASKPEKEDTRPTGINVRIRVIKNKVSRPGLETNLYLIQGKGFDEPSDIVTAAIKLEIKEIVKNGAWFEYKGIKAQGETNFIAKMAATDGALDEILQLLS